MCDEALQGRLLQFHFQSRLRRIQGRVQQAMDVPAYGAQRIRFRVETEDDPFLVVIVDGLVDIQERYLVCRTRKVRAPYARSRLYQTRLLQLQKDLADDNRIHAGAARYEFRGHPFRTLEEVDAKQGMDRRRKTNADFHNPQFNNCCPRSRVPWPICRTFPPSCPGNFRRSSSRIPASWRS